MIIVRIKNVESKVILCNLYIKYHDMLPGNTCGIFSNHKSEVQNTKITV